MQGNLPRDPVCGLEIHPDDVDSWVEYGGTQYYFCCPDCQKAFAENPTEYAEAKGDEKAQPEVHHKEDGQERHTKHQARV